MDLVLTSDSSFNYEVACSWVNAHRHHCFPLLTVYLCTVYFGQKLMKTRDPLKLNYVLIGWNLLLTIFSIFGTVRAFPEFAHAWATLGFRQSYCQAGDYFSGTTGYWAFLFTLSKAIELGDSVFLVLRKRPVIFLHWYHHATMLIYVWIAYPDNVANSRWAMMMNLTVHSFMYSYYLLRSLHVQLPSTVAKCVTSLQITQMVVGVYITADVCYRTYFGLKCDCPLHIALAEFLMYVSYLALFANFFYRSYLKPRHAKTKPD